MYKKVSPNLDFCAHEKDIIDFWCKNRIFEKSVLNRECGNEFSFYDGPPTANGMPHIGHILTRVMKDIIPRYKTMKGYRVFRKAGWDTHGLPVELEIEKKLGLNGKQDIEAFGVEAFIKLCKESVFKYKREWEEITRRIGYWIDLDDPYITYDDKYIESVWWSIAQINAKGLLYKGLRVVPYCCRCGTSLSSHEIAQGYKDITTETAVVSFKVKNKENEYILAWTTTPWTLPNNTALCINPHFEYCVIESDGKKYILAKELIKNHFESYSILESFRGKELEGIEYEPLYTAKGQTHNCFKVVVDDYVTLTDGTGVVHIAPAFGEDDSRVGRKYHLPSLQYVDERGNFDDSIEFLRGVSFKDADKLVLQDLTSRSLIFKTQAHDHSYPHCWRCNTPLMYYARAAWFIRTSAIKERLVENNENISWYPPGIGSGRMGNFLENVVDWSLSRERYWGTPLPVWVCSCGHTKVIESKKQLMDLAKLSGDIELHKPYVDQVVLKCECGGDMHRTSEVIDCWYDSGSMPFAQFHYPFENKKLFERIFPADFISEGVDQTRGWFYTLLAISTMLFDTPPFKNCLVLGHVNDKYGEKMSKSKGNGISPWEILNKQGGDALRWFFYTNSAPWLPIRFYDEAVSEAMRKFLGTLWNIYSFYVLYAEIDGFNPQRASGKPSRNIMDKWILSELNSLILAVDKNLEHYEITEGARAIAEFCDILSNWYVRRCRERFWGEGVSADKSSAFETLYQVLSTLVRICAPFIPFMSEEIYQNIERQFFDSAAESVHLCDFPIANERLVDPKLEKGMRLALAIVENGRSARSLAKIKNRQPLSGITVHGVEQAQISEKLKVIIAEELNVKEIDFIDSLNGLIEYEVKPQLKTLGSKYGAKLNIIREYLSKKGQAAAEFFVDDQFGIFRFKVGDDEFELASTDILTQVKNTGGHSSSTSDGITVILDTVITKELFNEGLCRELVSKIQALRKESGFEIVDRIITRCATDEASAEIFRQNSAQIASETLSSEVFITSGDLDGKQFDINGIKVVLALEKAR